MKLGLLFFRVSTKIKKFSRKNRLSVAVVLLRHLKNNFLFSRGSLSHERLPNKQVKGVSDVRLQLRYPSSVRRADSDSAAPFYYLLVSQVLTFGAPRL